jgi:hypothetical protein
MANRPIFTDDSKQSQWGPKNRRITRKYLDRFGAPTEMRLERIEGAWATQGVEAASVQVPGARPMTVREFVAGRIRETRRYGSWVEINRDVAGAHPELLNWCRQRCNSELPAGGFRFAPRDWENFADDELTLPFVPEIDASDPTVRQLAEIERSKRELEQDLRLVRDRHRALVREASSAGYSRRSLAELLGISFGRIQQLVDGN